MTLEDLTLTDEQIDAFKAAYEEYLVEEGLRHSDAKLIEYAEYYAADLTVDELKYWEYEDAGEYNERIYEKVQRLLVDAYEGRAPGRASESSRGRIFKVFNPAKVKRRLMR